MTHWFRLLVHRVLSSRQRARRGRSIRRSVNLDVESLELRTLTTVLPIAPPAAAPAPAMLRIAPIDQAAVSSVSDDAVALNNLLEDMRQLDLSSVSSASVTITPIRAEVAGLSSGSDAAVTESPVTPPPHDTLSISSSAIADPVHVATNVLDDTGSSDLPVMAAPVTSARPVATNGPTVTAPTLFPTGNTGAVPAFIGGPVNTAAVQALLAPDSARSASFTIDVPRPVVVPTIAAPAAPALETPISDDVRGTDGALLQQFVNERDQGAFDILVRRHQPFVLNVCRRVLGDAHGAEDAAQATFLILARKAATIDPTRSLAGWLYMVAYHIALRLRAVAARRRRSDLHAARGRPSEIDDSTVLELDNREVHQVLREELQQLPDQYRVPLALCYFDGRTHAQAAQAIGMPRGSIAKRIGEGLALLRERLMERGISL